MIYLGSMGDFSGHRCLKIGDVLNTVEKKGDIQEKGKKGDRKKGDIQD